MKLLSHIFGDGWNIAYRHVSAATILEDRSTPFTLIPNTWRTWVADPFVFSHEGTVYLFAEIFDYLTRKGTIGYSSYVNGKWQKWRIAIDEPFHMSYPNVFVRDGQIYMVPETSADHTLRLYRAVSFPATWQLEKIIAKDVDWVDTTFFVHEKCCCAITTDISDLENHKNLMLSFDDQWDLMSCKEIHEKQTDISRSGGNFIVEDHRIVRVTQDCRDHYGSALVFSQFCPEKLMDTGMGEILFRLEPKDLPVHSAKKWIGLHTYNRADGIEVVDLERRRYNPLWLLGLIIWKIGTYLPGEKNE